jgi:SEC-C motif-containing protein
MCYCGETKQFSDCCKQIISGEKSAQTAEQLMRSRYSAYVVVDVKYLISTTYPTQQKNFDEGDIRAWAIANQWQKLEVIGTQKGKFNEEDGEVEFKASYIDDTGTIQIHHEKSTFVKENGQWYYLSGIIDSTSAVQQTQKRNDFCACGSGKKYKKCCGK